MRAQKAGSYCLQLGTSEIGFMKPELESQAAIFRPAFRGQGVWIAVDVEDVETEYRRIQAMGVPIELALREEPWGDRHFAIVDPNGIGVDVVQRSRCREACPRVVRWHRDVSKLLQLVQPSACAPPHPKISRCCNVGTSNRTYSTLIRTMIGVGKPSCTGRPTGVSN